MAAQNLIDGVGRPGNIHGVIVYDAAAKPAVISVSLANRDSTPRLDPQPVLNIDPRPALEGRRTVEGYFEHPAHPVYYRIEPILSGDGRVAGAVLLGRRGLGFPNMLAERRNRIMTTTAILIALLSGSVLILVRRNVSRPIQELVARVRRVGVDPWDRRVEIQGAEEIEELAREFNQMCDRLQELYERLAKEQQDRLGLERNLRQSEKLASVGQLAAGLAHEIGTPLNIIGGRADGPFVPLNCAAIPETLLESELFGYLRGAFTDARKDRRGLFQDASGGILFLDEIGEVPLSLQAKLLRVLEDKEVRPLGANQSVRVDARVVSATNRPLEVLVAAGKFRQDLFYRLNVIRIELPPLRRRSEDIPLLVDHFIRKFASSAKRSVEGIQADALAALKNHPWPGNIRELEHTIERAVLLGKESMIGLVDLPESFGAGSNGAALIAQALTRKLTLHDLERDYIGRVLQASRGNKTEAARILGVDRTTLYRKLEEYKIKE